MVPVGGGGMLSGICIAAKALKPGIKIYAAEPLNADDCAKSFVKKELIPQSGKDCDIECDIKLERSFLEGLERLILREGFSSIVRPYPK